MIHVEKEFKDLGLSEEIQKSLNQLKYYCPSEIQEKAIPHCITGKDVIIQACAGTGKTLCYLATLAQLALTKVLHIEYEKQKKIKANDDREIIQNIQNVRPYAIVLVPTRELAIQVMDIYSKLTQILQTIICSNDENSNVYKELVKEVFQPKLFIGGLPIEQDRDILKLKRCSIVIGTLGRIMQLVQEGVLMLHEIKMVILDEADKLLENRHFQPNFRKIMGEIIGRNQENLKPQVLCLSATYPEKTFEFFKLFMNQPLFISTVSVDQELKIDEKQSEHLSLPNLEQFYYIIQKDETQSYFQVKVEIISNLLKQMNFRQAIIFYNDKNRGENLFNDLRAEGFKPIFIHGDQSQSDRIKVMHQMRRNKVNIIISTDLLSRGIDVETLDIVIHFDIPQSIETYFHRIGRTGRFGSYGFSILLTDSKPQELNKFQWTKEWNTDNENRNIINDKLYQKFNHQNQQSPHQEKKEYFAQYLNGVSEWRDKNYQFYDESKFKYKLEQEEPFVFKVNLKEQKNKKNQNKQDKIVQKEILDLQYNNQTQHLSLNEILQCAKCKEFVQKIGNFQNMELKIQKYFK